MAVVNTTLPQSPAPDNSIVPTPPLSDGTIFMYRTYDDLITRFTGTNDPKLLSILPDPEYYFTSVESLLEYVREDYHCSAAGEYVQSLVFSSYGSRVQTVKVYRFETSDTRVMFYIYVWAITPMGGAA